MLSIAPGKRDYRQLGIAIPHMTIRRLIKTWEMTARLFVASPTLLCHTKYFITWLWQQWRL